MGGGVGVTPFASILREILHVFEADVRGSRGGESGSGGGKRLRRASTSSITVAERRTKLKRVHFLWVTRSQASLSWFGSELRELNRLDVRGRISIAVHLTSVKSKFLSAVVGAVHAETGRDVVSGAPGTTRFLTKFGRPDWEEVFKGVRDSERARRGAGYDGPVDVGVFSCSNRVVEGILAAKCKKYGWAHVAEVF